MKNNSSKTFFGRIFSIDNEKPAEEQPSFLTLTPNTIRFGHGSEIFQLQNVARIGKFRVSERKFPIAVLFLFTLAGLALSALKDPVALVLGIVFLVTSAYGFWTWVQPRAFAFGIETNSGTTRYLKVRDEQFVSRVVDVVTEYMENKQTHGVYINIEDRSIKNAGVIVGDLSTGDRNG